MVRGASIPTELGPDGFWLGTATASGRRLIVVAGRNERGVLYGAFALLHRIALGEDVSSLNERREPSAPVRWINHWDNLDGTIERGYAGRSIFFENGRVLDDLTRVRDYGRLLASVGINGATINNVNANALVITDGFIPQLARVADALRPWGIAMSVSIDFSSPRRIGGLDTFDPLDPRVAAFWKDRVDALYRAIPDLGGFVLKADSEGRLGPSAYNRTHADAANVIARALAPHNGVIFYRGFVYNHLMDWRDVKNDRARAAYDNFHALDGRFDANVVLQIKHGPIDFQVREPASPLFGALRNTNQAIELQITQEYLGQQRHVCFLVPMWKDVLDFDLQATSTSPGTPVRDLVSGRVFNTTSRWVRRSIERRPRQQLARARPRDGESLRLRPAGLESDDILAGHRRRLDEAHLRSRSAGRRDDHQHPARLVAGIRALHRTARRGHADRHHRRALRARHRIVGAKRLGSVAPRQRHGDRHGSHGGNGNRLRVTVHAARRSRVRVSCVDAG